MSTPPDPVDDELERLRQLVQGQYGGRVRDLTIRRRDGGLALGGRASRFHVKQLVQKRRRWRPVGGWWPTTSKWTDLNTILLNGEDR